MAYDANTLLLDEDYVSRVHDIPDKMSAARTAYYADSYAPNRPPVLNEQYSRVPTDLEQPLDMHCDSVSMGYTLEPVTDTLDMPEPSLLDGGESSIDSLSTVRGDPALIPDRIYHITGDEFLGLYDDFELHRPLSLTEYAVAAHEDRHTYLYPNNIDDWAREAPALPGSLRSSLVAPARPSESLILPSERSTTSSRSGLTGSSWTHVHPDEAEPQYYATDFSVCATGGQFFDVPASPFAIDKIHSEILK